MTDRLPSKYCPRQYGFAVLFPCHTLIACANTGLEQSPVFTEAAQTSEQTLSSHDIEICMHAMAAPAEVLKDVLSPSDHIWFQERFQEAAIKRYGRLQAACNEAVGSGTVPTTSNASLSGSVPFNSCSQAARCGLPLAALELLGPEAIFLQL